MADKEINTNGGAVIGKGVETGSGDFTGRDKTVQNYHNSNVGVVIVAIVAIAAILTVGSIGVVTSLRNISSPSVLVTATKLSTNQPVARVSVNSTTTPLPSDTATPTSTPDFISADRYYKLGLEALRYRNFEEAKEHLSKAINFDPQYAEVYYQRSRAFNELGDTEGVIRDLERAIGLKPEWWLPYYGLGVALASQRNYDPAIRNLKKAVALKPDEAEAWYQLGRVHTEIGSHNVALSNFNKALEIAPKAHYHCARAFSYYYLENVESACSEFKYYLTIAPESEADLIGQAKEKVKELCD
jgi:tetratricopeptide (TPR) repeat protein